MKSLLVALFGVASVGFVMAQSQDGLKKKPHAPALKVGGWPVTEAEANATFSRLANLFGQVLHVQVLPTRPSKSPNAPIDRSAVITEFLDFYRIVEPKFKVTLLDAPVDTARLRVANPALKKGAIMLIKRGCMSEYSTLIVGHVNTVSVFDFGDAVGFFIARISEMTHTPSSKWTPYLHGY